MKCFFIYRRSDGMLSATAGSHGMRVIQVVISGGNLYESDLAYITGDGKLAVKNIPPIAYLNKIAIHKIFPTLHDADMFIVHLSGEDPNFFLDLLKNCGKLHDFEQLSFKKIVISQDSHHMWPRERIAEPHFDRLYTIHENYLDKFSSSARGLPGYAKCFSMENIFRFHAATPEIERDVLFPYGTHQNSLRNIKAWKIRDLLESKKIKALFAKLYGDACLPGINHGNLLYGFQTSRIILNIPYLDDLNFRNFEVIAAGRALLTEELAQHRKVDLDYSHTYFFKSDLSDFDEAYEAAALDTGENLAWKCIPGKHMSVDRYLTVINQELGTHLQVAVPWDKNFPPLSPPHEAVLETAEGVSIHAHHTMLGYAMYDALSSGNVPQAEQLLRISKLDPEEKKRSLATLSELMQKRPPKPAQLAFFKEFFVTIGAFRTVSQ